MLNPPCDINAREIKRDLWFEICCEVSGTFHPARLLRNIWVASLRMFWLECLQYNDNYPHLAYNDISSTYLFSVGFCWADFCWCNIWNSTATLVISCLKSKHHKVSVSVDFFASLMLELCPRKRKTCTGTMSLTGSRRTSAEKCPQPTL